MITITRSDVGGRIELDSLSRFEFAVHLTEDAIRDVADAVEAEAIVQAPMGATGELKAHPVDINEIAGSRFGRLGAFLHPGESIETRAPTFGGGFAVRGAGGRFVKSTPFDRPAIGTGFDSEHTVEAIEVTIPDEPRHAIWVHQGTGIYGPNNAPILPHPPNKAMHWEEQGQSFYAKIVKGQQANPYLERAFVIIEREFLPARVEQLRLEIRAL